MPRRNHTDNAYEAAEANLWESHAHHHLSPLQIKAVYALSAAILASNLAVFLQINDETAGPIVAIGATFLLATCGTIAYLGVRQKDTLFSLLLGYWLVLGFALQLYQFSQDPHSDMADSFLATLVLTSAFALMTLFPSAKGIKSSMPLLLVSLVVLILNQQETLDTPALLFSLAFSMGFSLKGVNQKDMLALIAAQMFVFAIGSAIADAIGVLSPEDCFYPLLLLTLSGGALLSATIQSSSNAQTSHYQRFSSPSDAIELHEHAAFEVHPRTTANS